MKKLLQPLEQVEKILRKFVRTRDQDNKLLARYWNMQMINLGLARSEFFHAMYSGKLTSAESITRCRRKLQEQYPELRGKKYQERQKRSENIRQSMS